MEDVGKKGEEVAKGLGNKFGTLGKVVAGAFTVKAMVNFEKKIIGVYSTYDDQMRKIQAVTGATGEEYAKLQSKAEALGSSTRFSATEAGEGMEALARAGWKTDEVLAGIGETLTFATANSIDLGNASSIVANGLSMFGMKAEEAGRFTDVLSATASASNTDIGLLGETLKYSGALAGGLGYKIEDLSVAMGLMANKSIVGSQAGTTLKNAILRLNNPVGQGAKDIKKLGISMTDASGKVKPFNELLVHLRDKFSTLGDAQKAQYISTIFGTEAVAGMTAVLNASQEKFDDLTESINNSNGITQKMADTMDGGLGGALASVSSAWEGLLIKLGKMQDGLLVDTFNGLAKVLQGIPNEIEYISNKIQELTQFYRDHKAIIDTLAIGLGTMATGFLLVSSKAKIAEKGVMAFMKGTKLLKGIPSIMSGVGKAFTFLLSPAGMVTVAIAGIAMGAFLIYKNWDRISAWFANEWEYISNLFTNGYNSFIQWCTNIGTAISEWFSNLMESIANFLAPIGEFIMNIFKGFLLGMRFLIESAMTILIAIIQVPLNIIKGIISAIWNGISSGISGAFNWIKGIFSSIFGWITNIISEQVDRQDSSWNKIKNIIVTVWNFISGFITTIVTGIKNVITTVWESIKLVTTTVFNAIKGVVTTVWNAIKGVITGVVNGVKAIITTTWNVIKNVTSTVFNAIKGVVTNIWNGIKTVISNVVNGVKEKVLGVWNGIKETTGNIFTSLATKVGTIWNNIKEKITKPMTVAKDAVKTALDKIFGFFKNLKLPEIKIPRPKLPVFTLEGKFSLKEMTVPKLGVKWMHEGGIFTKPTVFPNGIGVGDRNNGRGSAMEAVLPIEKLKGMIREEMENMKQDVIINVDGRVIAQATVPFLGTEMEYRRRR
ncbi:phage tail tape measure protein [Clostridium tetani]|nr:phage tail tape measure protein [Clostridium tetani]RXI64152.1 phage tail tape measure protein [Clostridium tetani]RXI65804.1 phage tail tape measure protein [Clostridium tetani]RXI71686.1 phage tail tape measure protein [Clostridium tetani]RXM75706.1 phage tail tape measure protein [Clostridium tetani]